MKILIPQSAVFLLLGITSFPLRAQEAAIECANGTAHLHSDSPTPLLDMTRTLRRRGMLITFEGAPVEYRGDLIDKTVPEYHPRDDRDRAWDPRGGPFEAFWPVQSCDAMMEQPRKVLETILADYKKTGYPGEYGIEQLGAVFHIVPRAVRERDGVVRAITPVLDNVVTVPSKDSILSRYIEDVIHAEAGVKGYKAELGMGPLNWMMQTHTDRGCHERRARDCLQEILIQDGKQHTWEMNHSFSFNEYFLSIY